MGLKIIRCYLALPKEQIVRLGWKRCSLSLKVTGFSLPPDSPALHVIQHIRDESHDHAIGGHRKKRAKVKNTSSLETIEGVGPKRRQMLLKYMGGLQGLRNASVEEIAKVPGISQGLAEKIFWSLKH